MFHDIIIITTEEDEEWNERLRVLQDIRSLKKVAGWFRHPEAPIETRTGTAMCARCYFDRASAPESVSIEEVKEQEAIMADIYALKSQAQAFLHPERPVVVEDPSAFGRNYFYRPSAPEQEDEDDAEERELILQDMARLKQIAVDYLHPEHLVVAADPVVFGRCYYDRQSAPEKESFGAAEERARILAEAKQFKVQAELWNHPEAPLVVDATATARCYFDRPSAPERETFGAAEERAQILSQAKQFKAQANLWRHPERSIDTDPTAYGRNYFARPSAPVEETPEYAEERARILAEAKQLKAQCQIWRHPEAQLVVDPVVFGRNYFSRPSAPEQETFGAAEQRARILAEAKQLKAHAVQFLHPELPVVRSDPCATGRNFFSRPSAPEQETPEDAEERALVLTEAKQLRAQCEMFRHPEAKLVVEPAAFGRNYFSRPSAPEQESPEDAEERVRCLADAVMLLKLATDYYHPELPVTSIDPCGTGRNYFDRASAYIHDQMVHTFPVHEDDLHHDEHHDEHHWDHFGMDEDMDHMFKDMRHDLDLPAGSKNNNNIKGDGSDHEGGNLSRSPSSVMLFSGEPMYD